MILEDIVLRFFDGIRKVRDPKLHITLHASPSRKRANKGGTGGTEVGRDLIS